MSAPRRFPCRMCDKAFVSERAREAHERDAHFKVSGTRMDTSLHLAFARVFMSHDDIANLFPHNQEKPS